MLLKLGRDFRFSQSALIGISKKKHVEVYSNRLARGSSQYAKRNTAIVNLKMSQPKVESKLPES